MILAHPVKHLVDIRLRNAMVAQLGEAGIAQLMAQLSTKMIPLLSITLYECPKIQAVDRATLYRRKRRGNRGERSYCGWQRRPSLAPQG